MDDGDVFNHHYRISGGERQARLLEQMLRVVGNGDIGAGRAVAISTMRPVVALSLARAPAAVRVVVAAAALRERRTGTMGWAAGMDLPRMLVPDAAEFGQAERLSKGHDDITDDELCALPGVPAALADATVSALTAMDLDFSEVLLSVRAGRIARERRDARTDLDALGGIPPDMLPDWDAVRMASTFAGLADAFAEAGRDDLAAWARRTTALDDGMAALRSVVVPLALARIDAAKAESPSRRGS